MEYRTTADWDEALWNQAELLYHEAFPEHGRKNRDIIRRMFQRSMCRLHMAFKDSEMIAMALTGLDAKLNACIIDYLAVQGDLRHRGYGRQLVNYIREWAQNTARCGGLIIEAESEPLEGNLRRIRFWESCGFRLTEYVHHYIWVPEPYRAMVLSFNEESPLPADGETLFRAITRFHKEAYRGKG